jgi:Colicin E5 ribonuclease domain
MNLKFGKKILKQLEKLGWTKESVMQIYLNPVKTIKTLDTRNDPDGTKNYRFENSYIICNDVTGDVVQVSEINAPNWINPLSI